MESLLIYILKSAALLSIFYLTYLFLLRKDTSFTANRKFLLGGILAGFVVPAIYFTKRVYLSPAAFTIGENTSSTSLISNQISGWMILGLIYIIVTGFFMIRFSLQISQIIQLISAGKIKDDGKYKLVSISESTGPFSFFNYIFYNSEMHTEAELKTILIHEKVHVDQLHSLDILCANLVTALLWFNPLSWYYQKCIEQNLEYIADKETATITNNIRSYQHTLLKVCLGNQPNALVNHFHQSFIKKRIIMLNNKSSNPMTSIKMLIVAPLILAFMLCFNVKTLAQVKQDQDKSELLTELILDKGATYSIQADFTNTDLENLRQEMRKTSGLNLILRDLQRNDQGLISNLTVMVKGRKNNYVMGNYSNDVGIADLYFGYTETGGMKIYNLETE